MLSSLEDQLLATLNPQDPDKWHLFSLFSRHLLSALKEEISKPTHERGEFLWHLCNQMGICSPPISSPPTTSSFDSLRSCSPHQETFVHLSANPPWGCNDDTDTVLGMMAVAMACLLISAEAYHQCNQWMTIGAICFEGMLKHWTVPDLTELQIEAKKQTAEEYILHLCAMLHTKYRLPAERAKYLAFYLLNQDMLTKGSPLEVAMVRTPLLFYDVSNHSPAIIRLHYALLKQGQGQIFFPAQYMAFVETDKIHELVIENPRRFCRNKGVFLPHDHDVAVWLTSDHKTLTLLRMMNEAQYPLYQAAIDFPLYCLLKEAMKGKTADKRGYRDDIAVCLKYNSDLSTPWQPWDCEELKKRLPYAHGRDAVRTILVGYVASGDRRNEYIRSLPPRNQRSDIVFCKTTEDILWRLENPLPPPRGTDVHGSEIATIYDLAKHHRWLTIYNKKRGIGKSFVAEAVAEKWDNHYRINWQSLAVQENIAEQLFLLICRELDGSYPSQEKFAPSDLLEKIGTYPFALLLDGLCVSSPHERLQIARMLDDLSLALGKDQVILVTTDLPGFGGSNEKRHQLPILKLVVAKEEFYKIATLRADTLNAQEQEQLNMLLERLHSQPGKLVEAAEWTKQNGFLFDEIDRKYKTAIRELDRSLGEKEEKEARQVLRCLALLPAGATQGTLSRILPDVELSTAIRALEKENALIHEQRPRRRSNVPQIENRHRLKAEYLIEPESLMTAAECELFEKKLEEHYSTFVRECVGQIATHQTESGNRRLHEEYPNIVAVMDRAHRTERDQMFFDLLLNMAKFYWWNSIREGADWIRVGIRRLTELYRSNSQATDAEMRQYLEMSAECHYRLGDIYRRGADYHKARRYYLYAKEFYRQAGHLEGVARSLKGQADCYRRQDQYNDALSHYQEAEGVLSNLLEVGSESEKEANQRRWLPLAHIIKGHASTLRKMARFPVALKRYEAAYSYYVKYKDLLGQANCLREMGEVRLAQGLYRDEKEGLSSSTVKGALTLLHEARKLFHEIGARLGEAHCFRAEGEIAWWQGRIEGDEGASACLNKAEKIYAEYENRLGKARCYYLKGQIARIQGNYIIAFNNFNHAEHLYNDIWVPTWMAKCVQGKADVFRHLQRHQPALALYRMAGAAYRDRQSLIGEAACRRGEGEVLLLREDWLRASRAFEDARDNFREAGTRHWEMHATLGYGIAIGRLGLKPEAEECIRKAQSFYDQIGDTQQYERATKELDALTGQSSHPNISESHSSQDMPPLKSDPIPNQSNLIDREQAVVLLRKMTPIPDDSDGNEPDATVLETLLDDP